MKTNNTDSTANVSRFARDKRQRVNTTERVERNPRPRREGDSEGTREFRPRVATKEKRSSYNPHFTAENRLRPEYEERKPRGERNFERTERTVAGWSRSYNWVDRVKQREIEDARNTGGSALNAQTTDVKTRYRILMNNLIAKASQKIAKGELSIRNIQDLERVVKLDLLLMGEATDNTTSSSTTELSKADQERLDVIAKLLGGKK